jgi:hypothetical protein
LLAASACVFPWWAARSQSRIEPWLCGRDIHPWRDSIV